jgi:transposase
MPKKYVVRLKTEERALLTDLTQQGQAPAKALTHARILLKADGANGQDSWTDEAISDALDISIATIERVRRRYVTQGLQLAVARQARTRERSRRLDGNQEAHLIALACNEPPVGHTRWTLRLLADRMVRLEYVEAVSHETVRHTLKKTKSSLG